MQSSPEAVRFLTLLLPYRQRKGSWHLLFVERSTRGTRQRPGSEERLPTPSAPCSARGTGRTEYYLLIRSDREISVSAGHGTDYFLRQAKDNLKLSGIVLIPTPPLNNPPAMLDLCWSHLPAAHSAIGARVTPMLDANLFLAAPSPTV